MVWTTYEFLATNKTLVWVHQILSFMNIVGFIAVCKDSYVVYSVDLTE